MGKRRKRKHQITLSGEIAVEAMDQSQDRPRLYTAQYCCQNNLAEYYGN